MQNFQSKPSKVNKEFSYTFDEPGVYLYQCSPHKSMGMIALVIVGGDLSNIDDIASTRVVGKVRKARSTHSWPVV